MAQTNRRMSWVFKTLMAIALASTLAFPYAAFAFDGPNGSARTGESEQWVYGGSSCEDSPGSPVGSVQAGKFESANGTEENVSGELSALGKEALDDSESVVAPLAAEEAQSAETDGEPVSETSEAMTPRAAVEIPVTDETELRQAIAQATGSTDLDTTIKILNDIQLSSQINIELKEDDRVTMQAENGAVITAPNSRHFGAGNYGSSASTGCILFKNVVLDGAGTGGGIQITSRMNTLYVNAIPGVGEGAPGEYQLTVQNCVAVQGGAIELADSSLVDLYSVQLLDNHATNRGGAAYANDRSTFHMYQSTVKGNTADVAGGGVYVGNPVKYYDRTTFFGKCTFENNAAPNGGALYTGSFIEIIASTFQSNQAEKNGGAICARPEIGLSIEIGECSVDGTRTVFSNNRAGENGGALYADSVNEWAVFEIRLNRTTFERNEALSGNGGAVSLYGDTTEITVADCLAGGTATLFADNKAFGNGGALYTESTDWNTLTLNAATFSGNSAGIDGGGAYALGRHTSVATNENCAEGCGSDLLSLVDGNTAGGKGGAFRVVSTGLPHESDTYATYYGKVSIVSNNTAQDDGGAVSVSGGGTTDAWLGGLTLLNNTSVNGNGGGVAVEGTTVRIATQPQQAWCIGSLMDMKIVGNKAENGGGIYAKGLDDGSGASSSANVTLEGVAIEGNEARAGDGGGVFVEASDARVALGTYVDNYTPETLTNVSRNKTSGNGGGVYVNAVGNAMVDLSEVAVEGNEAQDNGGAVYYTSAADADDPANTSSFSVSDSSFTGNAAGVNGGAIWLPYDYLPRLTIDDTATPNATTFAGNAASRETQSHLLKSPEDIALHDGKVFTDQFSVDPHLASGGSAVPFIYAYNNHDVSYRDVYLVGYDGNGATGGAVPVDGALYASGDVAAVLGQGTLVRDGYTFGGWALSPDSMEPVAGSVQIADKDITLYAIWHPIDPDPPEPPGPVDPTDPPDPTDPTDPGDNEGKGTVGLNGAKAKGLAATGDPLVWATAFGGLAAVVLGAGLLMRRRLRCR